MVPRSLRSGLETARASGWDDSELRVGSALWSAEELVVAGGGKREIAQAFGVDGDNVGYQRGM